MTNDYESFLDSLENPKVSTGKKKTSSKTEYDKFLDELDTDVTMPAEKSPLKWEEVPLQAALNAGPDLVQTLTSIGKIGAAVPDVARDAMDAVTGATPRVGREQQVELLRKMLVNPNDDLNVGTAALGVAGGMAKHFAGYLDPQTLKERIAYSPISTALDASAGLGGLSKGAQLGKFGQTSEMLQNIGKSIDPLNAMLKAGNKALPYAWKPVDFARTVLSPKEKLILDAAKGSKQAEAIAGILNAVKSDIPGYKLTALQGLADVGEKGSELAGLAKNLMHNIPNETINISNQQRNALLSYLDNDFAATPDQINNMLAEAKNQSDINYNNVRNADYRIPQEELKGIHDYLKKLKSENRLNSQLVGQIDRLSNQMVKSKGKNKIKFYDSPKDISSLLDDLKNTLGSTDYSFLEKNLVELKKKLTDTLPGYEEAQAAHAEAMTGINQMQVGASLKKLLQTNKENELANLNGKAFIKALSDENKLYEKATGFPLSGTLESKLEPEQYKIVKDIHSEFIRDLNAEALAAESKKKYSGKLPSNTAGEIPTFFNNVWTLTKSILTRLGGSISEKQAVELAASMLSPKGLAGELTSAALKQAEFLQKKRNINKGVNTVSSVILDKKVPVFVNSASSTGQPSANVLADYLR